jgi:cell division protein FtsB
LFQTYTPLLVSDRIAPVGAVEIDYLYDALQSEGASAWSRLQALLAALFLVSLGMFVLSMRAPVDTEDAGTSLRGRVNRLRGGPTLEPGQPAAVPPVSAALVSPGAVPVGSKTEHEVEAANARIAELEEALAAAEWEASGLRASDAAHATTVAALESERRALETRAEELSARVTSLEAQLAELETSQGSQEPQAEEELEPNADEQTDDSPAPLEVRVVEPEQRVTDADDLRARLARTAARKKGITTVGDGDQPD